MIRSCFDIVLIKKYILKYINYDLNGDCVGEVKKWRGKPV